MFYQGDIMDRLITGKSKMFNDINFEWTALNYQVSDGNYLTLMYYDDSIQLIMFYTKNVTLTIDQSNPYLYRYIGRLHEGFSYTRKTPVVVLSGRDSSIAITRNNDVYKLVFSSNDKRVYFDFTDLKSSDYSTCESLFQFLLRFERQVEDKNGLRI